MRTDVCRDRCRYIHTDGLSVHPYSLSDFNEIHYVSRGWWVLYDDSPYDPISSVCRHAIQKNNGELWRSMTISIFSGQIFDICPYSASRDLQASTIWETSIWWYLWNGWSIQLHVYFYWSIFGGQIEWFYFWLHQIQHGGWPPSWKFQTMISLQLNSNELRAWL